MKNRISVFLFSISICSLSLVSCSHAHEGHDGHGHGHEHEHSHAHEGHDDHTGNDIVISPDVAKAQGISSEILSRKDFSEVIEVAGVIENTSDGSSSVVANVSGQVRFLSSFVSGQKVSSGASLFRISSDNFEGGNSIERAKLEYESALSLYEENKLLYDKKVISRNEFMEYKTAFDKAHLNFMALSKGSNGRNQTISSPISGYIQEISVNNGDYVEEGQVLATIIQTDRLYLKAEVPLRYASYLDRIVSAKLRLSSGEILDLSSLDGKVIARGVSNSAYYIPFAMSFRNPGGTISGQMVDAYLIGGIRNDVLSVPVGAIVEEQGLYFAYIQEDEDCYEKREIKVGQSDGQNIEVLFGLDEGDRVVVSGAINIKLASASNAIPAHTHSH